MTAVLVLKVKGFFFIVEKGLLATQYRVKFFVHNILSTAQSIRNKENNPRKQGTKKQGNKKKNQQIAVSIFPLFVKKQNALRKGVFKLVYDWLGQISLKVIL